MNQKPTEIKIKYTGPVSMNARTINSSIYTINGRDVKGESLKSSPLKFDELISVLNFIESNLMSNKIYFDGTIPNNTKELVQQNITSISHLGINKIKPIEATDKKNLEDMCRGAAEQSSELIKEIDLESLIVNKTDRAVKNFEKFEKDILNSARDLKARKEISEKIIEEVFHTGKSYTGSKCVAGIILAKIEGKALVDIVSDYFKLCRSDEQKSYLVGALINRFRTNYINKLSSQDRYEAAYQIDPSLESLQSQQTFLLWKYIFKRIETKYNHKNINVIQNLFSGKYSTFPIGFAAILHPKSNNIESLLENAFRLYDDHFVKLLANNTDDNRYLHKFEDNKEFEEFQNEIFSNYETKYLNLSTPKFKSNIILNKIPEIIGLSSAVAFNSFIKDHNDLLLQIASGVGIPVIMTEITKKAIALVSPNNKYNVFVNNIEKLSSFYAEAFDSSNDISKKLGSQIEKIFDRKLVL
ncbi:hypothetical protein [Kordia jejudonensis]|uniref:hypothetical protein n=1 Tax=Kordia jejudonensis TaxID=1348245 RepID=UPI000629C61C|nr:hypothetical protein [Kordia jejudonensis]